MPGHAKVALFLFVGRPLSCYDAASSFVQEIFATWATISRAFVSECSLQRSLVCKFTEWSAREPGAARVLFRADRS